MNKIILAILILLLALGCTDSGPFGDPFGVCDDCNDNIDDYIAVNGLPNDVNSYEANNYWTVTYWYWCLGVARTWTQSGCNCDESTYTFTPICP